VVKKIKVSIKKKNLTLDLIIIYPMELLEIPKEVLREKIMNFPGLNLLKKEWQFRLRFLKIMLFQKIKFFQV
jgi:hypothetical protein